MKKIFVCLLVITCVFSVQGCASANVENCVYKITAEYVDSGVIGAHMQFTYSCDIQQGTDVLKFNLFPNAFRKDAKISPIEDIESQYGEITVISVKQDGAPLKYSIVGSDKNILRVELANLVSYGESVTMDIEFGVILPSGDYRMSKGESTVNLGNWYPQLCVYENGEFTECEYGGIGDPFYSKVADYLIKFTVPAHIVVAASGKASACDIEGGKTVYSYQMENVRDFAFCLSDKFEVASQELNGITVNYYYYDDDEPQSTLDVAVKSIDYFSTVFGDYPYPSFSVAQSNFNAGGMEYSGMVYITEKLNKQNRLYTTVHEAAHQWWYGVVGNNQLEEAYLDEGLTEYSTAIFFDEYEEFGISAEMVFTNAKNSCSSYNEILNTIGETADNKMVKNLNDFKGEMEYVNIAYNRGLTMMKSAEDAIGRDKVKDLLSKYFKKHSFKIVTTEDFLDAMKPTKQILSAYIDGKAAI